MLQKLMWAGIALVMGAGVGLAADKGKKEPGITGQLKKVDAAAGTFTLTVRVSKSRTAMRPRSKSPSNRWCCSCTSHSRCR